MLRRKQKYEAVVVGTSAGGKDALTRLLTALPTDFSLPVIIVQHLHPEQSEYYIDYYSQCALTVKEAGDKEAITPGFVYFAPPSVCPLMRFFVLN